MSRLVVYGLRHVRNPELKEYVFHTLAGLREHADELVVIKPRGFRIREDATDHLNSLADGLWENADLGNEAAVFEQIAYYLASAGVPPFDEVVWLDDSLIGPIGNNEFFPTKASQLDVDGWTLTDGDAEDGPESTVVPFLALRGETFAQPAFRDAIDGPRCGYGEFVTRLTEKTFAIEAVYPREPVNEVYFARDSLPRLRDAGIPFIPLHTFTRDPLVNDRWGVVPRETYDWMIEAGYPAAAIWDYLLLAVPPRTWYTNLSMAEILPTQIAPDSDVTLTTAVLVHIYYTDMAAELLDLAANIPGDVRVVATTNTDEKKAALETQIGSDERFRSVEVRVVTSNRGRDISAFLVDCADVLRDPAIDMIVKLHSKRSVQDPASVSGWFRRHLFENLFASRDYTRNVYELFEREPGLGMVFPPTIHMGLPTMGRAWSLNLGPALSIGPRLGLRNPFDTNTPLSPYGSMFIARREVLEPLLEANFAISEFPDAPEYRDGSLAHVLERLISYVGFSRGFYAKTVSTPMLASISEPFLEYKLQGVGEYMQPHTIDQVATLRGRGENWPLWQSLRRVIWVRMDKQIPGSGKLLSNGFRRLGKSRNLLLNIKRRIRR